MSDGYCTKHSTWECPFCEIEALKAEVKSLNKVVDAAVKVEKWHTGEIKSPYVGLKDAVYQELFDALKAINHMEE